METEQMTMLDILIETHLGLERQGPGSAEATLRALSFVDLPAGSARIADLGCGTGGQTLILAQHTSASVVALDQIEAFIEVLNDNAKALGLDSRMTGVVGSMEDLPFDAQEFDLIWSEGAIDAIGFEQGLRHWRTFLKPGGYVAVTAPSWLADERPEEVARFWADAESPLDSIEHHITIMLEAGFRFVAAFTLPQECWTKNYFAPRRAAEQAFAAKHRDDEVVAEYLAASRLEEELYARYGRQYGYVFYIGQKV